LIYGSASKHMIFFFNSFFFEDDEDEEGKPNEEVWLTSRLVEMSVSLTRRWNALVDEQAAYIFSNLNA
jgi:hypothetical protein